MDTLVQNAQEKLSMHSSRHSSTTAPLKGLQLLLPTRASSEGPASAKLSPLTASNIAINASLAQQTSAAPAAQVQSREFIIDTFLAEFWAAYKSREANKRSASEQMWNFGLLLQAAEQETADTICTDEVGGRSRQVVQEDAENSPLPARKMWRPARSWATKAVSFSLVPALD